MDSILPFIGNVKVTKYQSVRYILPSLWMREILKVKDKGLMYASLPLTQINNGQYMQIGEKSDRLIENINPGEICLVIHEFMIEIIKKFDIEIIIHVTLLEKNIIDLTQAIIFKKEKFEDFSPDTEDDRNIEEVYMFSNNFRISNSNSKQSFTFKENAKQISNQTKNHSQIHGNDVTLKFSQIEKDQNGENDKDRSQIHTYNVDQPLNKEKENKQKIPSKKVLTNSTNDKTIKTVSKSSSRINNIGNKSPRDNDSMLLIDLSKYPSTVLEPKGLHNPSIFCFMNTCLQCLCSIPELNYYFIKQLYKKENKSKKTPTACVAFCDLLFNYSKANAKLRVPESIYSTCRFFFQYNQQQDCQEFLRRFLGKIQEELNYDKKYIFPDNITHEKAWSMYREVNPSFIDSVFTGLMRSSVKCCKCEYTSYTFDPFLDLSLSIDRRAKENLKSCLNTYFQEEKLDCNYKCSKCKRTTSVRIQRDLPLYN